ncbi:NADH:flavin oxidoreductase/NADH oxidase [Phreatobacter stygius]|uniref:NADH:flavin oxidoreductase/NADH oxidase n=1 Tax=Phreatobacter stygius TaxID=1940610 RepID=A0A4D7BMK5_9HYPH|nr:NADH:flavin oxidoreductase/NADH oxidase [Phreatobacter stygius]QCI68892.1 NADH:flavin oxidoreductase/NADH oxidase [Phreatobacter stygius]
MSQLFTPLDLGPLHVPNRIVVAPMCQYSANDGCANDWHLQHLMTLAMSGAGLVVLEATAVERAGRITHGCLGLYSDANEAALTRVLAAARTVALPGTRFGIQIGHAGRKGSAERPWEGGLALKPGADPWDVLAASAIAFDDGWHRPKAVDAEDIARITQAFVLAAERAARIGFDVVELHMAHGYLLHNVMSPISNRRDDGLGGSRTNRFSWPLAIAGAVKAALPDRIALGARITGQDWAEDGLEVADAVALAAALKAAGLAFVCLSSGGIHPKVRVQVSPGYQVPFAREVRAKAGIATRAVGMIARADHAEEIVASGAADQVALGRAILDDPRWGWHAAEALGASLSLPPQYARVAARLWPGAALARPRAA